MSAATSRIARHLRARRDAREFDRALATASPAMRQELLAAAAAARDLTR